MNPTIDKYRTAAVAWVTKLSKRERMLIGLPIPIIVVIFLYSVLYRPIADAFASQRVELEAAQLEIKTVAVMLEKFKTLRARRQELETRYREIEIKEGGLTLLESLIRAKLDPPPGSFTIKEGGSPSREFGGSYEQQNFIVDFTTGDLGKLVAFLQEVVHGPKPLILKRLEMRKQGERLHVVLDVSSIRRIKNA